MGCFRGMAMAGCSCGPRCAAAPVVRAGAATGAAAAAAARAAEHGQFATMSLCAWPCFLRGDGADGAQAGPCT